MIQALAARIDDEGQRAGFLKVKPVRRVSESVG